MHDQQPARFNSEEDARAFGVLFQGLHPFLIVVPDCGTWFVRAYPTGPFLDDDGNVIEES